MSWALWNGIVYAYLLVLVVDSVVRVANPSWVQEWNFWAEPINAVLCFLIAMGAVIYQQWVTVVIFALLCAATARRWWHDDRNNRRRKKALQRLAGRVRDMGGRLKVVRPSEG